MCREAGPRVINRGLHSGAAVVKGPYIAETFPVSVEEDYLVGET